MTFAVHDDTDIWTIIYVVAFMTWNAPWLSNWYKIILSIVWEIYSNDQISLGMELNPELCSKMANSVESPSLSIFTQINLSQNVLAGKTTTPCMSFWLLMNCYIPLWPGEGTLILVNKLLTTYTDNSVFCLCGLFCISLLLPHCR